MLFLYIFLNHFISAFTICDLSRLLSTLIVIQNILLWIQWMCLSISILMLDSQEGQVEGLFRLPEMPFFHDLIDNWESQARQVEGLFRLPEMLFFHD